MERFAYSELMWRWIDANEKELGIGRPYRDRDPPHVAPIDGKEYADKRGLAKAGLVKANPAKASPAKAGLPTTQLAKTGSVQTVFVKTQLPD